MFIHCVVSLRYYEKKGVELEKAEVTLISIRKGRKQAMGKKQTVFEGRKGEQPS